MARIGLGNDTEGVNYFDTPRQQSDPGYGSSTMPTQVNRNPGGWWNPPGTGVNDPSGGSVYYPSPPPNSNQPNVGGWDMGIDPSTGKPYYSGNPDQIGRVPGNPYDIGNNLPKVQGPNVDGGRSGIPPVRTGPMPRYPDPNAPATGSSLFNSGSTAQDLINYLNSNHLDPTGAQSIVQQYAQAQGLSGNQGNPNGMDWGAYDASRQKYYVPGYDVRYENGQWVPHAWGAGDSGYGTSTFSDPATQGYEQLLNQLIGQFMTPQTGGSFQSVGDYLKSYFNQLQQPVYTDQQRGVIQGQALDPISKQRDATAQQIIQHFASQGVPQSSGIVQKALQDSNQQFEQMRTQTQNQFAANEITQGKQNQAAAAQLGPSIVQYEQSPTVFNEQRALQAAQLAGIVPNLAWQRLTGANNLIQPINPFQGFGPLAAFQQQGYNQGADYGQSLAQFFAALAPLFS